MESKSSNSNDGGGGGEGMGDGGGSRGGGSGGKGDSLFSRLQQSFPFLSWLDQMSLRPKNRNVVWKLR